MLFARWTPVIRQEITIINELGLHALASIRAEEDF
jgi:hypothetical protein